jgi:hypothetical protein
MRTLWDAKSKGVVHYKSMGMASSLGVVHTNQWGLAYFSFLGFWLYFTKVFFCYIISMTSIHTAKCKLRTVSLLKKMSKAQEH